MSDIEVDILALLERIYRIKAGSRLPSSATRRDEQKPIFRKEDTPHSSCLKKEVDSWVERVTAKLPLVLALCGGKITRRIESAEAELNSVRQAYAEAGCNIVKPFLELNTTYRRD